MGPGPRFNEAELEVIHRARIIGLRAGSDHRFTGVWVVTDSDRVYVRSWNDHPRGWFRAFVEAPTGDLQIGDRIFSIVTRVVMDERIQEDVSIAFAEKYPTAASRKWVEGFAQPHRMKATLELLPAAKG